MARSRRGVFVVATRDRVVELVQIRRKSYGYSFEGRDDAGRRLWFYTRRRGICDEIESGRIGVGSRVRLLHAVDTNADGIVVRRVDQMEAL